MDLKILASEFHVTTAHTQSAKYTSITIPKATPIILRHSPRELPSPPGTNPPCFRPLPACVATPSASGLLLPRYTRCRNMRNGPCCSTRRGADPPERRESRAVPCRCWRVCFPARHCRRGAGGTVVTCSGCSGVGFVHVDSLVWDCRAAGVQDWPGAQAAARERRRCWKRRSGGCGRIFRWTLTCSSPF